MCWDESDHNDNQHPDKLITCYITGGSSAAYKGVTNNEYTVGLSYEVGVDGHITNSAKNLDNAKPFMDRLISDEYKTIPDHWNDLWNK